MGLRQVLRKNPSAAIEIWTLGSRIQHPEVSKFKPTSEGSAEDSFLPSKSHVPNFSPLGFMVLKHESRLERF